MNNTAYKWTENCAHLLWVRNATHPLEEVFHEKTFHFPTAVSYRAAAPTEILVQWMPVLPRTDYHPTRELIDPFDMALENILAGRHITATGSLSSKTTRWGYL